MEIQAKENGYYVGDASEPKAEIHVVPTGETKWIIDHTYVSDELRDKGLVNNSSCVSWKRRARRGGRLSRSAHSQKRNSIDMKTIKMSYKKARPRVEDVLVRLRRRLRHEIDETERVVEQVVNRRPFIFAHLDGEGATVFKGELIAVTEHRTA